MNAHDYPDLEIALSHDKADQYRVELRFRRPGSDLVQSDDPVLATLDPVQFGGLDDPAAHGQALTDALFGLTEVMTRFVEARATARAQHPPLPLRLRLRFDWQAGKLHALRWETLRGPQNPNAFLATDLNTPLSRYLRVWDQEDLDLQPRTDLKALTEPCGNLKGTLAEQLAEDTATPQASKSSWIPQE